MFFHWSTKNSMVTSTLYTARISNIGSVRYITQFVKQFHTWSKLENKTLKSTSTGHNDPGATAANTACNISIPYSDSTWTCIDKNRVIITQKFSNFFMKKLLKVKNEVINFIVSQTNCQFELTILPSGLPEEEGAGLWFVPIGPSIWLHLAGSSSKL